MPPMVRIISNVAGVLIYLAFSMPNTYGQEHSFQTYMEGAVRIAETTGGPRFTEDLFTYELVLTLYQDEEIEESLLVGPYRFFMDENGAFFVEDAGSARIVVFNDEGHYSHSIGRMGAGPGEFASPTLQSVHQGVISVFDWRLRRLTHFQTDGSLVETISVPLDSPYMIPFYHETPDGSSVLINRMENVESFQEWIRVSVYDESQQVNWTKEFEKVKPWYRQINASPRGNITPRTLYHFGTSPLCTYDQLYGIIYTPGWEPYVDFYQPDGTHYQRYLSNIPYESTSRGDRQQVRQFLQERIESNSGRSKENFITELDNLELPDHKAFWTNIEVDDNGFLWMEVPTLNMYNLSSRAVGRYYRVFSSEGEYLGTTQRPFCYRSQIDNGHLLLISSDRESGEMELHVYMVHPAIEGLIYP